MNRIFKLAVFITIIAIILAQQPPLETQARQAYTSEELRIEKYKNDSIFRANYAAIKVKIMNDSLLDSIKTYTEKTDSVLVKSKRKLFVLKRQQKVIREQIKIIDTIIRSQIIE